MVLHKKCALDWNYTGLCQHSGVWYYITKGQVNWNYTGSCIYNGKSYYVEKGVLNWKYNSAAVYSSASYTADLMNAALSQYQAEEVTIDETNIYSADTEPESTQTAEQCRNLMKQKNQMILRCWKLKHRRKNRQKKVFHRQRLLYKKNRQFNIAC